MKPIHYQNGVSLPVSIESRKAKTHHSSVNIATRPTHSQLNRLIILRLPLALPPYTTNPSTYASGLLHIAPIYITFEYLWQTILDAPRLPTSLNLFDTCDPEQPLLDSRSFPVLPLLSPHNSPHLPLIHNPKVCSRTHSLLSHLRLPGLLRAGRLRADIRVLTGTPEHKIGEQLNAVSKNGRLAEFIAHTKKAVEANPHVLLAYAWVLYMALFSGGRYLRASLNEAGGTGVNFWTRDPSPVRPYSVTRDASPRRGLISETADPAAVCPSARPRTRSRSESVTSKMVPGMSFFNFVGEEDGEDIKREFKKRITEAEVLLTPREKEDIVTEAEHIFEFMVTMVAELDAVMGTKEEDLDTTRLLRQSRPLMASRDSVAVAKERLEKGSTDMGDGNVSRKPSFEEVLVTTPAAKLVRFKGAFQTWDEVIKPLGKSLSGKLVSSQVSFETGKNSVQPRDFWVGSLPALVLVGAILMLLLGWYYSAARWFIMTR
jgi:heme oxygenase